MVDLKAKPFYLSDDQIQWVEDTIAGMTLDEKVGQLFINLTARRDPETLNTLINKYHIGGVRWQGGTLEEVYEQNTTFLRLSLGLTAKCSHTVEPRTSIISSSKSVRALSAMSSSITA